MTRYVIVHPSVGATSYFSARLRDTVHVAPFRHDDPDDTSRAWHAMREAVRGELRLVAVWRRPLAAGDWDIVGNIGERRQRGNSAPTRLLPRPNPAWERERLAMLERAGMTPAGAAVAAIRAARAS